MAAAASAYEVVSTPASYSASMSALSCFSFCFFTTSKPLSRERDTVG
jgi:hypothetical protein